MFFDFAGIIEYAGIVDPNRFTLPLFPQPAKIAYEKYRGEIRDAEMIEVYAD